LRRTVFSIFAVVLGTTLLVGLKTQSLAGRLGMVADAPADPAAGAPDGTSSGPPAPGQSGPGAHTPTPSAHPGSTPKPGQTSAPVGGKTTTTPPGGGGPSTTTAPPTSKTYTGAAIAVPTAQSPTSKSSPCGDCANYSISVTITVSGGRVTKASASYNPSPGGSQSFANRANSQLSQSILSSQTWNLGPVSGATYAGNAWELSAKDAMSQAGL
jgi:uncharacterized protein with FMN-binding domain